MQQALTIVVVTAAIIGTVGVYSVPAAAVGTGAVIAIVLLIVAPWLLVAGVIPASFITYRVGPVGTGLSVADMALVVGVMAAFIFLPRPGERLLRHLLVALAFLAVLMIPAGANPTTVALVEWGHRLLLVVGGLIVGAAIVNMDQVQRALRIFVAVAVVVASVSIVTSLVTGFQPAYPLGFSKNHTGGLLAIVLILVAAFADYLKLPPRVLNSMTTVLVLGLIATQSRGAMLALIPGLAYLAWRRGVTGSRWRYVVPIVAVMIAFSVFTLRAEMFLDEGRSSSFGTRIEFQRRALDDWSIEPVLGQGIRYYLDESVGFPRPVIPADPLGGTPSPHNIVLEVLSESGIVGMVAFAILIGGTLVLVGKGRSQLAIAAGAVIVVSVTHGLFDIYWVGGLQTVPWVIVGMSAAIDDSSARDGEGVARSTREPIR